MNVRESINNTLDTAMKYDCHILLLGEDICDPYGGAFNVTKGLSTTYPSRVINTPISEAGIIGLAIGLALEGYRPVVEIMFGDFMTLVIDQLLNHASKIQNLFERPMPITIRTTTGGAYYGLGATHSQSIEKLFFGIPGLKVIAPSIAHDPGQLLRRAIYDDDPVIYLEHKGLYQKKWVSRVFPSGHTYGVAYLSDEYNPYPSPPFKRPVYIYCYGGMSVVAEQVRRCFKKDEVKVIVPSWVNDPAMPHVMNPCVIVDEAQGGFGWADHIVKFCHGEYIIVSTQGGFLSANPKRNATPGFREIKEAVDLLIGG